MKTKMVISAILLLAGTHMMAMNKLLEKKLKKIEKNDKKKGMCNRKSYLSKNHPYIRLLFKSKPELYFKKDRVPEISSDIIRVCIWKNKISVKKKTIVRRFDRNRWRKTCDPWHTINIKKQLKIRQVDLTKLKQAFLKEQQKLKKRIRKQKKQNPHSAQESPSEQKTS